MRVFKAHTEADKLWSFCADSAATVMDAQTEEKAVRPPKLYDLTALQRDANRLFGYSAKKTLEGTQSLYEQKLCAYPRTDSRFLTEDFRDTPLPELAGKIPARLPFLNGTAISVNAGRVIDGKKVTDHHALIPTQTFLTADLGALPNQKKGKEPPVLPDLHPRDTLRIKAAVYQGKTEPPKHYTEDTLLAAMKRAGAADFAADNDCRGIDAMPPPDAAKKHTEPER